MGLSWFFSITLLFFALSGWKGISIEKISSHFRLFKCKVPLITYSQQSFIACWGIFVLNLLVFSSLNLVDACLLMFLLVRVNDSGSPFLLDQFA